jgi:hypothetical protein
LCVLQLELLKNCRNVKSSMRITSTLGKKTVKKIYADAKSKGGTRT